MEKVIWVQKDQITAVHQELFSRHRVVFNSNREGVFNLVVMLGTLCRVMLLHSGRSQTVPFPSPALVA